MKDLEKLELIKTIVGIYDDQEELMDYLAVLIKNQKKLDNSPKPSRYIIY